MPEKDECEGIPCEPEGECEKKECCKRCKDRKCEGDGSTDTTDPDLEAKKKDV